MSEERRENDKQVEALRQECNRIEREVCFVFVPMKRALIVALQMVEHLKTSQGELNALLAEYWSLRRQIGASPFPTWLHSLMGLDRLWSRLGGSV